MGLVSIEKVASRSRKASIEKIRVAPGFTKNPYFRWLVTVFKDGVENGALLKKSAWKGGLEVVGESGKGRVRLGAAFLDDTEQVFALHRSGPAHATGYLVVPATDKEFSLLAEGKSVNMSYPEVLWGVDGYNDQCIKRIVPKYIKKGGRRETKYVLCSYKLLPSHPDQGMFDPQSLLIQVRGLLRCLVGSEKAFLKDADFVLDDASLKEEATILLTEIERSIKMWSGEWDDNIYLPSVFSRGLLLSGDHLRENGVPLTGVVRGINYVDVSKGAVELKYFSR